MSSDREYTIEVIEEVSSHPRNASLRRRLSKALTANVGERRVQRPASMTATPDLLAHEKRMLVRMRR